MRQLTAVAPAVPMAPEEPPVIESFEAKVEATSELQSPEPSTEMSTRPDSIYSTPLPVEATTINPLEKVNISQVTWLPAEALTTGMVELDVFGEKMRYFLCNNSVSRLSVLRKFSILRRRLKRLCNFQNNSSTLAECSAPGIPLGKCRHLTQCVMRVITDSVQAFIPYQCQRDKYVTDGYFTDFSYSSLSKYTLDDFVLFPFQLSRRLLHGLTSDEDNLGDHLVVLMIRPRLLNPRPRFL